METPQLWAKILSFGQRPHGPGALRPHQLRSPPPAGPSRWPRLYPISPLPIGGFGSAALLLPISVLRLLLSDRCQAALAAWVKRRRRPSWRAGGGMWPGCASSRPSCASGTRCRGAVTALRSASRTGGWRAVASSCCRRAGPR